MKVVTGLGNPGRRYHETRHNIGFDVLAELADRYGRPRSSMKFEGEIVEVAIAGEKVLLLAPQTYMNLSGRSVQKCVRFFQLELQDLIVVCDDMNLPTGQLRLRKSGSAGGQKGLQDIIQRLGTQDFSRLRIGIDRPDSDRPSTDYVLGRFSKSDRQLVDEAVRSAADGIEQWVRDGIDAAMNTVNAPREKPK